MDRKYIRKIIPAGIGIAGLAAPACAATCPKGIGSCPYPGKCFLYVDSDGNSLCDYTGRDTVSASADTDPVTASDSYTQSVSGRQNRGGGESVDVTVQSSLPDSSGSDSTQVSVTDSDVSYIFYSAAGLLVAGIAIVTLYFLLKILKRDNPLVYGRVLMFAGIVPLLLAVMLILSNPETFGFKGTLAEISSAYSGIVYMFAGTIVMAGLWLRRNLSKAALVSVLILTSAAGFLLVVPIAPDGFYSVFAGLSSLQVLGLGFAGLITLVIIALVSGRIFCAHMCPAGALQELLSRIPVKKVRIRNRKIPQVVRALVFAGLLVGFYLSYNIFEHIGVSHFFALMITPAAMVFVAILIMSVFVYRPFCTFICPYGLIFSIFSGHSLFNLRRTEMCINCKKCEKVCPTGVAGKEDKKAECYLCGRCIEKCPVKPAIKYGIRR